MTPRVYNPPRPKALGVWNLVLGGFNPPNPPRHGPSVTAAPVNIFLNPRKGRLKGRKRGRYPRKCRLKGVNEVAPPGKVSLKGVN